MGYSDSLEVVTVTISSGANYLSSAVDIGGLSVVGLVLPAAFEANTARLLFHVSVDGTNYYILADKDDAAVQVTVDTSPSNRIRYIDPIEVLPGTSVKVGAYQSDASTTVNQTTADREIGVVVARVRG